MTSNAFSYQHTQPGKVMLAVSLGLTALVAVLGATQLPQLWLVVPLLLICTWLFHSLTIEIGERELGWRFGPGLIHKRVALAKIIAAQPMRTSFLHGWGIHLTGYGWLYNVSGFDAVAITLRSGKRFVLGTDEPQLLAMRLGEVIRQNSRNEVS